MKKIDKKNITLFIILSFSFSWTIACLINLIGCKSNSITYLLVIVYMYGPTAAALLLIKLKKISFP